MLKTKLHAQYEGINVLANGKNFIVTPNEIFLFQSELLESKIMSAQRIITACHILTFKHDEKNPFPSNETLASQFKKSVRAIAASISDILKTGLFINEKGKYGTDKRKNTYNVTPFLNLLGVFVEHVREGKAYDIKELYNGVIKGILTPQKGNVEEVEAPKQEELPEAITEALNAVEDLERRSILEKDIRKNMKRLDEETLIYYISRVQEKFDSSKGTFEKASHTFYSRANNGDKEKHKQMDTERYKGNTGNSRKPKRVEQTPEWLEGQQEANSKRDKISATEQREREAHNKMVQEAVYNGLVEAFKKETGKDADEHGKEYSDWKMDLYMELPQDIIEKYGQNELAMYNLLYPNSVKEYKKVV